ncbi:MAG: NADH-quinone oxidoreductase subunit J family protein [Planctomycetota bacterium]
MAVVIFWAFALMVVGAAVMTVVARNILHAAVSLAVAFMGVAALYVFLHADFVAATQLIVYVGGIIVLIIFAVMFSAHIQDDTGELGSRPLFYAGAGLIGLFVILCLMLSARHLQPTLEAARYPAAVPASGGEPGQNLTPLPEEGFRNSTLVERHKVTGVLPAPAGQTAGEQEKGPTGPTANPVDEYAPATTSIGVMIVGKYLLAFEAVSVLLLAVVVAAVVLVRKETARPGGN